MILDIDLEKFLLITFQSKNNKNEFVKKNYGFHANTICMLFSKLFCPRNKTLLKYSTHFFPRIVGLLKNVIGGNFSVLLCLIRETRTNKSTDNDGRPISIFGP